MAGDLGGSCEEQYSPLPFLTSSEKNARTPQTLQARRERRARPATRGGRPGAWLGSDGQPVSGYYVHLMCPCPHSIEFRNFQKRMASRHLRSKTWSGTQSNAREGRESVDGGTLAAAALMSRSAFALKFKELVGETPLEYLTNWRMYKATGLLEQDDRKLFEVAKSVGYDSDGAFSKAFKRVLGMAPKEYRRSATEVRWG